MAVPHSSHVLPCPYQIEYQQAVGISAVYSRRPQIQIVRISGRTYPLKIDYRVYIVLPGTGVRGSVWLMVSEVKCRGKPAPSGKAEKTGKTRKLDLAPSPVIPVFPVFSFSQLLT
jgi:hypothetical protein